ncbi:crotonase/enoyl-CoA hydratase family protein [Sphingomonas canadensis]|uniref:Crotonase/enoyl-CoA hydratase family protein n=1 Tax=Sphingomonas canadensis TaxID=1219257 RepID=A0ABW3HBZ2_9SPHN|nr:crotonase/enoyl-CoA hydratase family protein [Sphingomonas canadensis]MCW3837612.1 crotonase/enoyl-CoA hydratase family protein [Sphingomonas canadensis]
MSESLVTYELDGDVAIVGIDRAAKRNAVNTAVMEQMHAAFERAAGEARVGVLFGHGGNFSAGLDLAEAASRIGGSNPLKPWERGRWTVPLDLVARGPIPWVAALQGACIGGGLEIASACAIRVADESTFFALPEAKRGIFVGGGGAVRIQRLMGYARMADMMLTGRVLSAAEGERVNLCQYVVPAGQSLEKAKELARAIATNAPTTNWAICAGLPRLNDMGHGDGLFFEALIGGASRGGGDTSRIAAFVERGENKVVAPTAKPEGGV